MSAVHPQAHPLIAADGLVRRYRARSGHSIEALSGVSLQVCRGESVAVVGESGSGKSTLVRCLAALERPDRGRVLWDGDDVATIGSGRSRASGALGGSELRRRRADVQVIFQDCLASFNPRFSVAELLGEPLRNFPDRLGPASAEARTAELLERVGLEPGLTGRRATDLSGGQQQRVAIARALATRARLLLCDEPVSGLDVSVQAQVIELLEDLRRTDGISLLFVTHNLSLVRYVSDRVAVMQRGRIVEELPSTALRQVGHPYARSLLESVPELAPSRLG